MTSTTLNKSLLIGVGAILTSVIAYYVYRARKRKSIDLSALSYRVNHLNFKIPKKEPKSFDNGCHTIYLQDPAKHYEVKLENKENINHDTILLRFALPSRNHILGLPVGQHIQVVAKTGDSNVIRNYTPVSLDYEYVGYMDLIVKVYFRGVHPKFPDGGQVSQYLYGLTPGDKITIRGPYGRINYFENGNFRIKVKGEFKDIHVRTISMIAGGSGITPMFQIIKHVTNNLSDDTKMALIYANQSENDIILRHQLDTLCVMYPKKLSIWYTVDRAAANWDYGTGFVDEDMISKYLYPASEDNIVLLCGPKTMIKFACLPNLEKLHFEPSMIYEY